MKNLKLTGVTTLSILTLSLLIITASCSKRQTLKSIDGTWNLVSISSPSMPASTAMTGTFIFGSCSSKENKRGQCSMSYDIIIDYGLAQEEDSYIGPYQIKDKGEHIVMLGSRWDVSFGDNTMTLTLDDPTVSEVLIYNFTR